MDTLRIYIITWNVATRSPDDDFSDLLDIKRLKSQDALPDFYVIGLQEVKSQPQNFVMDAIFNDPWTTAFKTTLAPYDYVKVKTNRLVGLLLNVFCLRKHIVHLRDINTEQTRTGLMGFWGNKGAVTTRLQIYGCSMCLVNSHLSPHDNLVAERVDDYNTILQGQKFAVKDTTTILFHDYVFWFGDLNFRLANESSLLANEIVHLIDANRINELLKYDQLKQVMRTGEAFSELTETDPTFLPTYKYHFHSQLYDTKRRPAWTDRILFRVNKFAYDNVTLDVKQISYKSVDRYTLSDHKPVVSEQQVKVFGNYSEKQVELSTIGTWKCECENKVLVVMDADVVPSQWDWVGLYQENFTGLDEYLNYVYLTSNEDSQKASCDEEDAAPSGSSVHPLVSEDDKSCENKIIVTFPDTAVQSAGHYRLIYFTRNSDSILGMSQSFIVEESSNTRMPLDW